MLKGDAGALLSFKWKTCTTYQEATDILRNRNNSVETQSRLLTEWHTMLLTRAVGRKPGDFEVTVVRSFVATRMSLRKQLDTSYHGSRDLRDCLLTAGDTPHIGDALHNRVPRTAQELIEQVGNHIYSEQRTAGSVITASVTTGTDQRISIYSRGSDDPALRCARLDRTTATRERGS